MTTATALIDDVHGADFVGGNVGNPLDDPASKDGNPDIPLGGTGSRTSIGDVRDQLRRRSGGG